MGNDLLLILALLVALAAVALLVVDSVRRHQQQQRQGTVIDRALYGAPAPGSDGVADAAAQTWRERAMQWLTALGSRFENGTIGKALITPEDRLLLSQVNYNTRSGRTAFLGLRLAMALLLPVPALLWYHPAGFKAILVVTCAIVAGVLLPKFLLDGLARRLRNRADEELPLLVDLLRLFQGVGFSVDQSLQMIADRFQPVLPLLGREVRDANAAFMRGRTRMQSLQHLLEFDNQGLKSLVQIIVQVHEHGGAVQEPLKQFADRLREQRKMRMKELSGKLSVKMTLVMMVTLLPALMLVLAGPAVISLIGSLSHFKAH